MMRYGRRSLPSRCWARRQPRRWCSSSSAAASWIPLARRRTAVAGNMALLWGLEATVRGDAGQLDVGRMACTPRALPLTVVDGDASSPYELACVGNTLLLWQPPQQPGGRRGHVVVSGPDAVARVTLIAVAASGTEAGAPVAPLHSLATSHALLWLQGAHCLAMWGDNEWHKSAPASAAPVTSTTPSAVEGVGRAARNAVDAAAYPDGDKATEADFVLPGLYSLCESRVPWGGGVIQVGAGDAFTAVVDSRGQLWMWGRYAGRCTQGRSWSSDVPLLVEHIPPLASMAVGFAHIVALTQDGRVLCMGSNVHGQCGSPVPPRSATDPLCWVAPRVVPFPRVSGANGIDHVPRAVSVACGGSHTVAVTDDGHVWALGSPKDAKLGIVPTPADDVCEWTRVPIPLLHPSEGERVIGVSCGTDHTVVWSNRGHAYSWGFGQHGVLGHEAVNAGDGFVDASSVKLSLDASAADKRPVAHAEGTGAPVRHENKVTPTLVSSLVHHMRVEDVRCGVDVTFFIGSDRTSE